MDHSTGPASPIKTSAIPRFSKLPTPKPVTIPVLESRIEPPSYGSSIHSPTKSKTPTPSPTKSTSIARPGSVNRRTSGLLPPGSLGPKPPPTQHRSAAQGLRVSTARPGSRTSQRNSLLSPSSVGSDARSDESNDRLGSLDSFRSSSRQGYNDPSPASEHSLETVEEHHTPKARKAPRPSLSDRTIESLFQLPATPATDRRRSGFFSPESPMVHSPMGPPARPASAMSSIKRPGTAIGGLTGPTGRPLSPTKRPIPSLQPNKRMSIDYSRPSPTRRSVSASIPKPAPSLATPTPKNKPITSRPSAVYGKVPTPRPTTNSLRTSTTSFNSSTRTQTSAIKPRVTTKPTPAAVQRSPVDGTSDTPPTATKSSAALRDQIARAKAAKRGSPVKHDSVVDQGSELFDLAADPFNQRPDSNVGLLKKRLDSARVDGRLNISAMSLKQIPEDVLSMYDPPAMQDSSVPWNECVDLVRFVASDNSLESISDDIFPDIDPQSHDLEELPKGCQFGGLEMLDFRGNILQSLPIGIRRLGRLTSLNLSHNKLSNSALDPIWDITTLKDLKLGNNNIGGQLPNGIGALTALESLDVQSNKLLSLPECLRNLVHLRTLNLSGNQLTGVPMDALEPLSLIELDVSRNGLVGALFPFGVGGMKTLKDLDISSNSLVSLAFSEMISLPALRTLNISSNRIVALPDVSGWTELTTLSAADNKISALPSGFTALPNIRQADFSNNQLARLDEHIALMESLTYLILAGNPLRERRFLSMSTENVKRDLSTRIARNEDDLGDDTRNGAEFDQQIPAEDSSEMLKFSNGTLDLAKQDLCNEDADALRSFLGTNDVRELQMSRNKFTIIPFELSLAQNLRVLDMSMCALADALLEDTTSLPALRELHLSGNKITSLTLLTNHLAAPRLQLLDVSSNRISGELPILRQSFPALVDLYAADNRIESITPLSLKGLHTAILARNNIHSVPPEIGLLWYQGLKGLDVGTNAFRVPNHRVLERGTEATLAWLRDRIPGRQPDYDDDETF